MVEQLTAADERDMRQNIAATNAGDLPLSFESLSDEWLTAVLCANTPGARFIGHVLGAADNGAANRHKIHLDDNQTGKDAHLPTALFCKVLHGLANRIMLGLSEAARAAKSISTTIATPGHIRKKVS